MLHICVDVNAGNARRSNDKFSCVCVCVCMVYARKQAALILNVAAVVTLAEYFKTKCDIAA